MCLFFFLDIGGLAEEVDEKVLHAAFIPFGEIIDIQIPLDYETLFILGGDFNARCGSDVLEGKLGSPSLPETATMDKKHRGFAFVEFEGVEEAAAAIDNMNDSELFGRTIRVNVAKPIKIKDGSSRAVWSEDSWLREHAGETLAEGGEADAEDKNKRKADDDEPMCSALYIGQTENNLIDKYIELTKELIRSMEKRSFNTESQRNASL